MNKAAACVALWSAVFGVATVAARAEDRELPSAVSFTYFARCIFVEASVNGERPLLFLIDTGANVSALDTKVAQKLHLPVEAGGKVEATTGLIQVKKARVKDLAVGAAHAPPLLVTVQDLESSLAPAGRRLSGILGYDFLRSYTVRIDFEGRSILFSKLRAQSPVHADASVARVPFILDNGIPRVKAVLHAKVKAELRLDTGASLFDTPDVYINIPEDVWKELTDVDPGLVAKSFLKGQSAGKEVRLPLAQVGECNLGGIRLNRAYVIVQPKAGYFARADAVGFVSNNFLEKFSPVTIDYLKKELLLSQHGRRK
jgi:hypothetical protein